MASESVTMKILVVGATGALGRPVVKALLAQGVAVRVVCRHPEHAVDLAALGAEVCAGDLADSASIARACLGIDRVLACAHGLLGRGRHRSEIIDDRGHRALIAAASAAAVQRFVYTSAYGAAADSPIDFFRTKWVIEQCLAASGLDTVVLRPTAFMEHHAHRFIGQGLLATGKVRLIGPGTKARNFVCAEDVARVAVRALLEDPPPWRCLDIGGPGHFSNVEVAALYARAAGIPLRIQHLPRRLAAMMAALARPLHPGLARVLHLSSLPDEAFDEHFHGGTDFEAELGLPMTTLEDFVRRQVDAAGAAARAQSSA